MSRAAAGTHGVNLMPLLDVLLCTMGTLIVILGVINREARLHPSKRLPGQTAAQQQQLVEAREDLELRIQQLNAAKEKTLADLNTSRTRLAGIEASSRELEDRLAALTAAAKQLPGADASDDPQRDKLRLELAQLNSQRAELEQILQKARREAGHRQPGYAVIPFDEMYKTSRRPIYIECRGDSVILQPEGIVFGPQDFLGPGGPSNPLASALRAAQEYWRNAPRPAPDMPNEPYPLLLVRPTGIIGYYLVRDAMSSWDAEFGYELVGEDWKLEFPNAPDPQLQEMENRAVAESRQQLQWLAQVSPELFSRKSSNNKTEYHVSPFRGGVVRDGGPSLGNDPFADDPLGGFGRGGRNGNSAMPGLAGGPGGNAGSGMGGGSANGFAGNSGNGSGIGQPGMGGTAGGPNFGAGSGNGPGGGNGFNGGNSSGGGNGIAGGPNFGSGAGNGSGSGSGNAGPEVASVGPRYSGNGNGTDGFGPGGNGSLNAQSLGDGPQLAGGNPNSGNGTAGPGTNNGMAGGSGTSNGNGTGNYQSNGSGNYQSGGSGNYQQSGSGNYQQGGNGNGSNNSEANSAGGSTNRLAGAPTGGVPGNGSGNPSEYGGVLLPNSAGGMMSSGSHGYGNGPTGSGNYGSTSGSPGGNQNGSGGGQFTGGDSSSGANPYGSPGGAAGGSDASSGSGGGSPVSGGSPGGATALGSPGGDPNAASGSPSLSFDMSPQQNMSSYDDSTRNQQQQQSSSSHSMAKSRGKNWALPTSHTASVPVQRPIRVECYSDRLELIPDTKDQQVQVIPLGQRTEDSVEPLVGAVRTYTRSWGIAGRSMYWKPQLVLKVNPNADARAADLQTLLADSGWDVKRK